MQVAYYLQYMQSFQKVQVSRVRENKNKKLFAIFYLMFWTSKDGVCQHATMDRFVAVNDFCAYP
jgi:hypothetical protein